MKQYGFSLNEIGLLPNKVNSKASYEMKVYEYTV